MANTISSNSAIAKICGQRWARLLPLTHAAAYVGEYSLEKFRRGSFADLIVVVDGREVVDRLELDNRINEIIGSLSAAQITQ